MRGAALRVGRSYAVREGFLEPCSRESRREYMGEVGSGEDVAVGGSVSASRGREVVNWWVEG